MYLNNILNDTLHYESVQFLNANIQEKFFFFILGEETFITDSNVDVLAFKVDLRSPSLVCPDNLNDNSYSLLLCVLKCHHRIQNMHREQLLLHTDLNYMQALLIIPA